jgi:cvfA/B/C family virulence factor
MARYRILTWRGIPAQVKVRDDAGRRLSRPLPERFQQEIDRVAMRDEVAGSDAYLAEWTWSDEQEREGSAEEVAAQLVDDLAADWDRQGT